jgi:RHS repeat-associated protein
MIELCENTGLTADLEIKAKNNYTPFGKTKTLTDGHTRNLYIGKEVDTESSLADHGVRKYDPAIGRLTCPDVLWEKYAGWSPYHYTMNNPVGFTDGNGLLVIMTGIMAEANAVIGGGGEVGLMIGPDGVFAYTSDWTSISLDGSASLEATLAVFPDMPTTDDATGEGIDAGATGGEFLCGSFGKTISGNYGGWVASFGIGGSIVPINARVAFTNTRKVGPEVKDMRLYPALLVIEFGLNRQHRRTSKKLDKLNNKKNLSADEKDEKAELKSQLQDIEDALDLLEQTKYEILSGPMLW